MQLLFLTATRVGDAVLSTGLLAHYLVAQPEARVTVVVGRPGAPIFQHVPRLERLIVFEKRKADLHWLLLWRQLVGRHWDLIVDLRSSGVTRFLRTRRYLATHRADKNLHRVTELGRLAGIAPPSPCLWLSAEEQREAAALCPRQPFLALAPTANWVGKQWPAERFAELADRLTGADGPLPGAPIVVFGAEHERAMAEPLMRHRLPGGLVDLVGRTSLNLAGACFARASLFVGNDSGLMHLAAAAGAPTLGLFGPTPDARYAPWGLRAAVVRTRESYEELDRWRFSKNEHGQVLMHGLAIEEVERAARDLLDRLAAAPSDVG